MMFNDDHFAFINIAKIRVLIVPVHPIRQDTFRQYVDLLSQFSVVYLGDLTPPDPKQGGGSGNKFTEQIYHDGYIYYNFVTSYNREHACLEDFQLHRQVMGVIGIMHCQQVPSLSEGYKRFQQILQRYPTVLAHRCFAFEPSETQEDDVKGPIMIPNVGQLAFYLQTVINDFSSELLGSIANLAERTINRPMIQGPYAPSTSGLPSNPYTTDGTSDSGTTIGGGGVGATMFGNFSQLLTTDKTRKRTPSRAQKLVGDLYLMCGRCDLAISR
ncbi:Trafficking protein particle complex subunit 9 [Quaeritorhiza haematococci]|nr:Trafficking protein particle complex subunit 9 [Quaeritorhiza haematococci]